MKSINQPIFPWNCSVYACYRLQELSNTCVISPIKLIICEVVAGSGNATSKVSTIAQLIKKKYKASISEN
jgi:hypothetical protein